MIFGLKITFQQENSHKYMLYSCFPFIRVRLKYLLMLIYQEEVNFMFGGNSKGISHEDDENLRFVRQVIQETQRSWS